MGGVRRGCHGRGSGRAAFTLLETLLAVFFFSAGAAAVLQAYGAAVEATQAASEGLACCQMLREKLADFDADPDGTALEGRFSGAHAQYRWKIERKPVAGGRAGDVEEITVSVWRDATGARSHEVCTWRAVSSSRSPSS